MNITIKSKYLGHLRCEAIHQKSQNHLITDAPLDNEGKGEAFSPTDLLATSLVTCMMTIMGIVAKKHNLNIEGLTCEVTKIMEANPRRVSEIIINFNFLENDFDAKHKKLLEKAAYSCPVAQSLHPDLKKTVSFNF